MDTTGSLPELWRALPRMKTIAQPFDRAEQEALLSGHIARHLLYTIQCLKYLFLFPPCLCAFNL